jgi:hypothetical protein
MASPIKGPEHPAEKTPDSATRGTKGISQSCVAELCPSSMRPLYHEISGKQRVLKLGR